MSKKYEKPVYGRPTIDPDLYDALVKFAKSMNKTPSKVACTAIRVYLQKKGYWED